MARLSISLASRHALAMMVTGFLLATGSGTISPPAAVTSSAMRPPSVATKALAPALTSACAISTVANSLPPASSLGTT